MTKPLGVLLRTVPGLPFGRCEGVSVTGIEIDSRRVEARNLFVALRGLRDDGTAFVAEAVRRGAGAVLLPAGCFPPSGVAGMLVDNPRAALAAVASAFYGHPSRDVRVMGVTGSNGKTTVAYMLTQILEAGGRRTGYWTTNEVSSGARRFRPALTTPEAHDMQRFLREVRDAGMAHACIEVSSHAAAQQRIAGVRFAVGMVTPVTPDHLDYHGTFEAYLAAKRSFIEGLPPDAVCVYSADDPGACRVAEGAGCTALPCGFGPGAAIRGAEVRIHAGAAECAVGGAQALGPGGPLRLKIPVTGRHNLQNALVALGAALAAGVPAERALEALARFRPPPRRLRIRRVGVYTLIDDVAMNEASFDAVCAAVAELDFPQLVVVVALRGNRGPGVNAAIAASLARWNRRLGFAPLIVSQSRAAVARYSLDYRVRSEEVQAFEAAAAGAGLPVRLFGELADAIAAGTGRLRPGGALLLLGTFGMDEGPALAAGALGATDGAERFPPPTRG